MRVYIESDGALFSVFIKLRGPRTKHLFDHLLYQSHISVIAAPYRQHSFLNTISVVMLYIQSLLLLALAHLGYGNPINRDLSLDKRAACPSSWTSYTAVLKDTCIDISNRAKVPTQTLINYDDSCTKVCDTLKPGNVVCLPPVCGPGGVNSYLVLTGDSCAVIAEKYHLTLGQLAGHNPGVDCNSLQAGTTICLDKPDGSNFPMATCQTSSTQTTNTSPAQSSLAPLAPGTASDCTSYRTVVQGDICRDIAMESKISVDLFYSLNPNVTKPDCSNLMLGDRYCTGVALPPTSTSLQMCAKVTKIKEGDTCQEVASENEPLSLWDFYAMNPSVNTPTDSDCPNLQIGQYYCVGNVASTAPR